MRAAEYSGVPGRGMSKTDRTHQTPEGGTWLVNIGTSQNRYVLDKNNCISVYLFKLNFHFPQVIGFRVFFLVFFSLTRLFKG